MGVFKTNKRPKHKLYVAVVMSRRVLPQDGQVRSHRPDGDWSCFVAGHEEEAIQRAKAAICKWNGNDKYDIFVGRLNYRAQLRAQYDLIPL